MQTYINHEITPVLFIDPRKAVLLEEEKLAPAYVDAFLSAEPALRSEYYDNTTAWD